MLNSITSQHHTEPDAAASANSTSAANLQLQYHPGASAASEYKLVERFLADDAVARGDHHHKRKHNERREALKHQQNGIQRVLE